jgi:hypothetical protein
MPLRGNLIEPETRNSKLETSYVGGVCSGLKARNHGDESASLRSRYGGPHKNETSAFISVHPW